MIEINHYEEAMTALREIEEDFDPTTAPLELAAAQIHAILALAKAVERLVPEDPPPPTRDEDEGKTPRWEDEGNVAYYKRGKTILGYVALTTDSTWRASAYPSTGGCLTWETNNRESALDFVEQSGGMRPPGQP